MYLNNTKKMNSSLNWMGLNNMSEPFISSSFSLKEINKHMLFLVILIFIFNQIFFMIWMNHSPETFFLFSHSMIEINKYELFDFK